MLELECQFQLNDVNKTLNNCYPIYGMTYRKSQYDYLSCHMITLGPGLFFIIIGEKIGWPRLICLPEGNNYNSSSVKLIFEMSFPFSCIKSGKFIIYNYYIICSPSPVPKILQSAQWIQSRNSNANKGRRP